MKSPHLSFSSILLINLCVNAQPSPEWESVFNGAGNKYDAARAMVVDAQNNIYVAGPSEAKKGNTDIAIVKYNAGGVQQWVATYNGTGDGEDYPNSLAVDANGNVYVTGRSMNKSNNDCITIKYGVTGNKLWEARHNGTQNAGDMGNYIQVDENGNVYVTGYANSTNLSLYGHAILTLKYNGANGVLVWDTESDTSPDGEFGREIGNSLVVDAMGDMYVTGQNDGLVTLKLNGDDGVEQVQWRRTFPTGSGQKILQDAGGYLFVTSWDAKTYKLDATDGHTIWESSVAMTDASFWDMAMDGAGNIYVTGYGKPGNVSNDFLTIKYNGSDGSEQWQRTYNGTANVTDRARSIAIDGSGNVYVTGYVQSKSGRSTNTNFGTIKYNSDGDEQWVALYSGPENKSADAFIVDVDGAGDVIVTGQTSLKRSYTDFATIKYSQGSPAVTHNREGQREIYDPLLFSLKTYPNPFNHTTTISYRLPAEEKVELIIFDLLGKQVKTLVNETKPAGIHNVNFSAGRLSAGTYLCRFRAGELIETRKLVVVK